MKLSWKSGIALVLGGIVLGGTLSAGAQDGEGTRPETKEVHFRGHPAPGGPGLIRSASVFEGEEDGTTRSLRMDRGELTAIAGSELTIEQADGETLRITIGRETRIHRDGERAEPSGLEVGDHVGIMREREGNGAYEVRGVMAVSAERHREMEQRRNECEANAHECEWRGHRGPGGPGPHVFRAPRPSGDERGDVEPAPGPGMFDEI